MGISTDVFILCHVGGGVLMSAPNAGNYPTPFVKISS